MTRGETISVEVTGIEPVTPLIKLFTLRRADGMEFPPFSGGSHVIVVLQGERTFRNPYSLLSSPRNLAAYQIAVRCDEQGRGGSLFLHRHVAVGTRLEISQPVNLFPLARLARKHILITGGVGITPMMAMIDDLAAGETPWELHYGIRSPEHGWFAERLQQTYGDRMRVCDASAGQRLAFSEIVARQPLGSHLYVCGPPALIEDALASARRAGWPESHLHTERFSHAPAGEAFEVYLARSQATVRVSPDCTLLEALEAAGVDAPYLCRSGACGRCEARVLELDGELIHHDHWLSTEEKAEGTKLMPCVSRARGRRVVLDL